MYESSYTCFIEHLYRIYVQVGAEISMTNCTIRIASKKVHTGVNNYHSRVFNITVNDIEIIFG